MDASHPYPAEFNNRKAQKSKRNGIYKISNLDAYHPYSVQLNKPKASRAWKNQLERARKGIYNEALNKLRESIPINTEAQKKLKLADALRMARNYIEALQNMLQTNELPTPLQFANILATGTSWATPEMVVEKMQVQPHLHDPQEEFDASSVLSSSSQDALQLHHFPQPLSVAYDPASMSSSPPRQYSYAADQAHAAFYEATIDEMLEVQPHLHDPQEEFDASFVLSSSSQDAFHLHHFPQPLSVTYDLAPSSSSPPPQQSYAAKKSHVVPRKAVSRNELVRAQTSKRNDALDTLREHIPINAVEQKKLSKIETLRMAMNYIEALRKMLQTNKVPTPLEYANTLANGMSVRTTEALIEAFQVQPHLIDRREQFDAILSTSFRNFLHCHHNSQQQSSDESSTSSRSAPQYVHHSKFPWTAPRQTSTN